MKHVPTTEELDQEANYFARCLLMPASFVATWIAANPGDLNDDRYVLRIARAFHVPIAAAVQRLQELYPLSRQ